jgi:hypothetical protein
MAGLSMFKGAAEYVAKIVAAPIDFIGQYLFLARHSLKSSLSARKVAIVLNGVAAAGLCLHNLSIGCVRKSSDSTTAVSRSGVSRTFKPRASSIKENVSGTPRYRKDSSLGASDFAWALIDAVLERDIPSMIVFFIELLADPQEQLSVELRDLQLYVGRCVLKGYDGYAELLNSLCMCGDDTEKLLLQLSPGGVAVCNVCSTVSLLIGSLNMVFAQVMKLLQSVFDEVHIVEVLDRLCAILAKLTKPKVERASLAYFHSLPGIVV